MWDHRLHEFMTEEELVASGTSEQELGMLQLGAAGLSGESCQWWQELRAWSGPTEIWQVHFFNISHNRAGRKGLFGFYILNHNPSKEAKPAAQTGAENWRQELMQTTPDIPAILLVHFVITVRPWCSAYPSWLAQFSFIYTQEPHAKRWHDPQLNGPFHINPQ